MSTAENLKAKFNPINAKMSVVNQEYDLSLVQLKILSNFLKNEYLPYSKGKPENISNDLYKYHLGHLVEKGLIEKNERKYSLTELGKGLVQYFDVSGTPQKLFKASVLIYLVRRSGKKIEILMQKRLRQPYFGDIETVSGKILPGEMIEEAAERRLLEETGLTANFKFSGVIRKIRKNKSGKVFEDTLYHVCLAKNPKGDLAAKNDYGENFWVDIGRAKKLVEKNKTFGTYSKKIINIAANISSPFFYLTEIVMVDNI